MRERTKRRGRAYAAIPNSAMRDEEVSLEARGLLAILMTYSDDWQFNRTHLMKVAGIGRDKFQRIMGELREAGYVALVQTREEGSGRLLGTEWVIKDEKAAEDREPENPVLGAESLKTRPPVHPASGKSGPIRRPTLKENQKEESPKPPEGAGEDLFSDNDQPAEAAPKPVERFSEFYEAYPRKIARGNAEKAWAKAVKSALPQAIIDGARRYAALCRQKATEAQYIAHPATWLNAQRWADEELRGVRLPEEITPQDRAAKFRPPNWQTVIR